MNNEMPKDIWIDINGNATRTEFKGGTKYVRADKAVPEGWRVIPTDEETVGYIQRYGGRCDCEDDPCEYTGMAHGDTKGIERVIEALNYGFKNGYLFDVTIPKKEPPAIGVEALKREADENGARTVYFSDRGWNACIDNLASKYDFVPKGSCLRAPLPKIEGLEEAIDRIFPMQLVSGDAMRRTNPHSKTMLNSTDRWAVTNSVSCSGQKLSQLLSDIEHACRAYLKASEV